MKLSPKRWRLSAIALLTALSTLFLVNSQAYASQPGEGTSWGQETAGGTIIQTYGALAEERSPNNNVLIQVWRTWDNTVAVSVNHGPRFDLPAATTYASPQVVLEHEDGSNAIFRVFHTGTDGHVYYGSVTAGPNDQTPHVYGLWSQVSGGVVTPNNFAVTVTGGPNGGAYLAYRGANSLEVWRTYFDGRSWDAPSRIPGVTTQYSPVLRSLWGGWRTTTYINTVYNLVYTGTDHRINVIRQTPGRGDWWGHEILSEMTGDDSAELAISSTGQGQVAVRHNNQVALTTINQYGGWQGTWDMENTGHVALAIFLVAYQYRAYLIAQYSNGYVDWKPSRQF
ncbi:hypothetical protein [Kitasatospora sp. NPDC056531]|uniref:hypothetical protein n=1 Tax=Kitasatospora sp. NPDC056531 TaxID=3345856 RepID=UPI0036C01CB9